MMDIILTTNDRPYVTTEYYNIISIIVAKYNKGAIKLCRARTLGNDTVNCN